MNRVHMLATTLRKIQHTVGRGILLVAPRHGFLDTIFHSYDDWRDFQEQQPAPPSEEEISVIHRR
jgi:hypothetical protein